MTITAWKQQGVVIQHDDRMSVRISFDASSLSKSPWSTPEVDHTTTPAQVSMFPAPKSLRPPFKTMPKKGSLDLSTKMNSCSIGEGKHE